MWIVCKADNSHEMSRLIFSEKKKKKKNQNVVFYKILLDAFRLICWWQIFQRKYDMTFHVNHLLLDNVRKIILKYTVKYNI